MPTTFLLGSLGSPQFLVTPLSHITITWHQGQVDSLFFKLHQLFKFCHTYSLFHIGQWSLGVITAFGGDIIFLNIWLSLLPHFLALMPSFLYSFLCPSFCWNTSSGNFLRLGAGEEDFAFSHVWKCHRLASIYNYSLKILLTTLKALFFYLLLSCVTDEESSLSYFPYILGNFFFSVEAFKFLSF